MLKISILSKCFYTFAIDVLMSFFYSIIDVFSSFILSINKPIVFFDCPYLKIGIFVSDINVNEVYLYTKGEPSISDEFYLNSLKVVMVAL